MFNIVDLIVIGILVFLIFLSTKHNERIINEFAKERKDLLDRLQAKDFQQYTNKVIREKAVEQINEIKPVEESDIFVS